MHRPRLREKFMGGKAAGPAEFFKVFNGKLAKCQNWNCKK